MSRKKLLLGNFLIKGGAMGWILVEFRPCLDGFFKSDIVNVFSVDPARNNGHIVAFSGFPGIAKGRGRSFLRSM